MTMAVEVVIHNTGGYVYISGEVHSIEGLDTSVCLGTFLNLKAEQDVEMVK